MLYDIDGRWKKVVGGDVIGDISFGFDGRVLCELED